MADKTYTHENAEEWDGYTYSKPGFSSEEDYLDRKARFEKAGREILEELKRINTK